MTKKEKFSTSIKLNDIETFKILLKDKEVDPASDGRDYLAYACRYGRIEFVELLLTDQRVLFPHILNHAMQIAEHYAQHNVINLLWNKTKVKETLKNDLAYNDLYKRLIVKEINNKLTKF